MLARDVDNLFIYDIPEGMRPSQLLFKGINIQRGLIKL